ncbi:MAG TPA: sugar ABC transporter ATP-binding protein [Vicinamibacterales bacterium]|jgi:ribose transport system ATP-binding protein
MNDEREMSASEHAIPIVEASAVDGSGPGAPPLLQMLDIRKAFPGVQALDGVSLILNAGEVMALLGENGAGKSTLIKVLTRLYRQEEGSILIEGHEVAFASPHEAHATGIAHVPQERNLIPRFSVGENIMLEALPKRGGLVDYDIVHREAQMWLDLLHVSVDSRTLVGDLSVAQMQLVEIARAISRQGRILVLDEPTASLTPHETKVLFAILRDLRTRGVAIIFVSHKLEEVFELCDTIMVLRDGRNAGPKVASSEIDRDALITLMVGRAQVVRELPAQQAAPGEVALELRDVTTSSGGANISLSVRRGEILGLYGLVGAGRSELARSIIGIDRVLSGQVLVRGEPVSIRSAGEALDRYRIGYVSENRKEEGLILLHSVMSNISITIWRRLQNALGWIGGRGERTAVETFTTSLEIKTPSLATSVGSLSGGNQQKVSLAKWLTASVEILIIDEPTVGIDVRTKANLHDLIWRLAGEGMAIILITSDMPEMVRLAHRIVVMRAGQVTGEIENSHEYAEMSQRIMGHIH